MAMNKIDGAGFIQPNILDKFLKSNASHEEKPDRLASSGGQATAGKQGGDRVEISEHARKLDDLRHTLEASRKAYSLLPDVRQERLAQARARLESGFYDSAEVRDEVAARLGAVFKQLESI